MGRGVVWALAGVAGACTVGAATCFFAAEGRSGGGLTRGEPYARHTLPDPVRLSPAGRRWLGWGYRLGAAALAAWAAAVCANRLG